MQLIGKRIKLFREIAGMKQKDFALRLGFSQNYVSLVEIGKREPSLKFLGKVSEELDVPISVLFWQDLKGSEGKDVGYDDTVQRVNDLFWIVMRKHLSIEG